VRKTTETAYTEEDTGKSESESDTEGYTEEKLKVIQRWIQKRVKVKEMKNQKWNLCSRKFTLM